jgi:outer membrane receptor protein involved in Fe transport
MPAACICLLAHTPVFAQAPAGQAEDDDNLSARGLEEIIVTARKREERLIDTPQSVSVLSSDTLSKLGAVQFQDFANTIPGLSFNTSGAGETQISLRGVTAGFDISPTVGIYVDDVPFGSSASFTKAAAHALDVALFDIKQVEVLRGPQGTLYGASTMGGLIKYVSKRPDSERFGADMRASTSGTQDGGMSYDLAMAVNTPLATDKAALRMSGFYSRDGGYIDNLALGREDVNRATIYGGRFDLLLTPTEALSIRFDAFYQDIARDGTAQADYRLDGRPVDGSLEQRHRAAEPFDQDFKLASGTVTYNFGPAELTSISSYQDGRAEFVYDVTPNFAPLLASLFGLNYSSIGFFNHQRVEKFTQEMRLASTGSAKLEWLIGTYYTDETGTNLQRFISRDPVGQIAPNVAYTYSLPSEYEELAGFANLTYHFTDKFDISGGIRYAENDQTTTQIGSGILIGSRPKRSAGEEVSTYLGSARYHFTDNSTAYLRYATGYRPGGPNSVANDPTTGLPVGQPIFEADTLKSYEVGFKAETDDRAYGLDIAAYRINWDNMQIVATRGGITVKANAGKALIDGGELTLSARPHADFLVTGGFAFQDARLDEPSTDLGARQGERLPNVPKFSAAMNADYEISRLDLRPRFGLTLRYAGERNASFDRNRTQVQYQLPDYTIVDLRAGVTFGQVELQLGIHNVTDERAELIAPTGLSVLTGPVQVSILQPRTFGVSAAISF